MIDQAAAINAIEHAIKDSIPNPDKILRTIGEAVAECGPHPNDVLRLLDETLPTKQEIIDAIQQTTYDAVKDHLTVNGLKGSSA